MLNVELFNNITAIMTINHKKKRLGNSGYENARNSNCNLCVLSIFHIFKTHINCLKLDGRKIGGMGSLAL